MTKNKQIGKNITGIMALIWMIIIFAFSAQPASQSSQVSGGLAYKISEWQNNLFRLDKTEEELYEQAESMQLIIRKGAHMGEYALLAFLLYLHLSYYALSNRKQLLLSLGITAGYAATDEIHQLFVPGRSGQLSDVCIDSLGALLGLIFCFIILQLHHRHRPK